MTQNNDSAVAIDDQAVLEKAAELGTLIADHSATKRLKEATGKLESDTDARSAMQQYQQTLMTLARKEQSGQPIEVAEKRALETAQTAVVHNLTIKQYQVAQMDYADLVRKLDAKVYKDDPLQMRQAAGGPPMGM